MSKPLQQAVWSVTTMANSHLNLNQIQPKKGRGSGADFEVRSSLEITFVFMPVPVVSEVPTGPHYRFVGLRVSCEIKPVPSSWGVSSTGVVSSLSGCQGDSKTEKDDVRKC